MRGTPPAPCRWLLLTVLCGGAPVVAREVLVDVSAVAAHQLTGSDEKALCGAGRTCESRGSSAAGAVLLQKAVKQSKAAPEEEAEAGSAALVEESRSKTAEVGAASKHHLDRLAEGLATGLGLINPLLQTTEGEYQYGNNGIASKATFYGELNNDPHEEGHNDPHEEGPVKTGGVISKAIGSDLLGDALDPTHHGEGSVDAHKHPHYHGYAALLFLFGGLVVGSLILMLHERFLPQLPYTCLLFIAGFLIAAVHNLKQQSSWLTWGSWYDSVAMWEAINPHLLFYVFLPALVFSEAMRLNKQLVKTCFWQILLLAGPGVLMGTAMLGTFSHFVLPYGWDWPISLVIGSILSATDPVAVCAIFNTLGVSPRLTMVISGESLLNDGTAFVVFTLMLKVVLGATLTPVGVILFFGNMTILSFIVGFCVASIALWMISCLALERGHSDAMVQVVITICCGYLCFFLAESEFSTSGILSLVSSGFALACSAWPRFVSKEVVHTVWEAIEFVGNTMVFLLAGLLFADSCFSRIEHILVMDLWWLFVMYVACMVARGILVLLLWIPLSMAGKPLTWREGLVLTWSGLRGAVSLAMAIIVDTEPEISQKMGARVMFHVGGIAALTLLINATTTGRLLKALGLTSEPEERERLMRHAERQMAARTKAAFSDLVGSTGLGKGHADPNSDLRFAGAEPDIVRRMVPALGHPPSDAPIVRSSSVVSADLAATRAARLQAYREIFLQVVQNHYWESIEQGIIPRNNTVAGVLLASRDEALSETSSALDDWSHILHHVNQDPPHGFWEFMANVAQHPALGWFPALPQSWPSAEVIQTWKIYAVLSYQEAHKCARAEVPGYFDNEDLDREVKEHVAEESRQRCDEAERLLDDVEASAVSFGRSRMLAQKLLRLQLEEVENLQKQGVLNNAEGHHLDEGIHTALLSITRAVTEKQWQRKF